MTPFEPVDISLAQSKLAEVMEGEALRAAEQNVLVLQPPPEESLPPITMRKRLLTTQIIAYAEHMGFQLTGWQKKALPGLIDIQKGASPSNTAAISKAEEKRRRKAERNLQLLGRHADMVVIDDPKGRL